ncbi:MAG: Sec-independent protein translocase protein TatB [Gammaproteobacteria bacterium]|jgi:sec-independent protein translocase protein TatB|nr:Sec-independent protein translocase protein TatB [Gammaproteobacteria bacterium]
MFDIGFWEIIFILVITLLVVGPERLPRIARTAGLWVGKMRGFVASVKADIDQELAAEELKKALKKQASVHELEELIDEVTGAPLAAKESHPAGSSTRRLSKDNNDQPANTADSDDAAK